jgi:hypothetical protein
MPTDSYFRASGNNLTASGTLNANNRRDTYEFDLYVANNVAITLSGLQSDADIRLFRASAINGAAEPIEEINRSLNLDRRDDLISQALAPGSYVVQVDYVSSTGSTNYQLDLTTANPNNEFNVGRLSGAQTIAGVIDPNNPVDRYKFSLNATSDLKLSLHGMSQDGDLRFGRDLNNNGQLETSEILRKSTRYFNFNESINHSGLTAGNYIVEVYQANSRSNTHYRLGLESIATGNSSSKIDLKGDILNVTAPDIRRTDSSGQAQVRVSNIGSQLATGNVRVNLYASTNLAYDSNDELLGSQNLDLNLSANQNQTYNFRFGAPTGIAPGAYHLIARIDTTNAIAESNESTGLNNNTTTYSLSAPGTDVVLAWNSILLNAFQAMNTPPPIAARNQAIVHAAIFDAINIIERRYTSYGINASDFARTETDGASINAAAAQAAYQVIIDLQPNSMIALEAQLELNRWLQDIPDGDAKTRGINIGQQVADTILQRRANDGASSGAGDRYIPGTAPGSYQFTNADNTVALAGFGSVTPFAIPSANQFTPAGPPLFGGATYAIELNEVKRLGSYIGGDRTSDQTAIATFWAYDRPDTFRPPAQWNEIAQVEALRSGQSTLDNARLFAHLNIAQADAGIVAWNTKYRYNQLRPISAVRGADNDGNAQTTGDANWQSLLATPPFPDYISGHSTFGAAAAGVLNEYFGSNYAFTVTSQEIPGVSRRFNSFDAAADENGRSRIYGGVHVESANRDGLATGRAVAKYVVSNTLTPLSS